MSLSSIYEYELDPGDVPEIAGAVRTPAGQIRLHQTRRWWFSSDRNLGQLVDIFEQWRSQDEYLHFAVFEGEEKIKEVVVLASKRGNRVYVSRVRDRILPLLKLDLPLGNRSWNKTKLLFLTLAYDTKLCSSDVAWQSIPGEYNRCITNLRNKFGKIHVLRVFECTKKGYPHIHVLALFEEAEFPFFLLNGKFRIPRKLRDKICRCWHSFVDVEAVVSPRQAVAYTVKYLLKVHGGSVRGKTPWEISQEGVSRALALLWIYKKRGYSMSKDLEGALRDLIDFFQRDKLAEHASAALGIHQTPRRLAIRTLLLRHGDETETPEFQFTPPRASVP